VAHLLCLDTSTAQVGVAVVSEAGILGEVRLARGRRHAEQLAPAITYLLGELELSPSGLAAIAVGNGPGLFTGLRVGVTTAKVMAQALRIPVIPVSSLDLLAHPLRHTRRLIVAAIDARRGEIYHASYRRVPGGIQRLDGYQVGRPSALAAELQAGAQEVLLVGDGALRYADEFAGSALIEAASPVHAHPSPGALAELALARYQREEFSQPWEIELLYLRKADAEANWEVGR
jgi:tRNA threonylcarbamoyladenosine biosynthesis protein TsaB